MRFYPHFASVLFFLQKKFTAGSQKRFSTKHRKKVIKINNTMGDNIGKFSWLYTNSSFVLESLRDKRKTEELFIAINISEYCDYTKSTSPCGNHKGRIQMRLDRSKYLLINLCRCERLQRSTTLPQHESM